MLINFLSLFGAGTVQQPCPQGSGNEPEDAPVKSKLWGSSNAFNVNEAPRASEDPSARAINESSREIAQTMLGHGIPGLTVCVSKRGRVVWNAAFGFCDVENGLECRPEARMRIASISKSVFAATIVGEMLERNQLDLNSSVHKYLTPDEFPRKKYQDKEVDITIKQLLSHTAGIKHYDNLDDELRPIGSPGSLKVYQGDDQYDRTGKFQRKTYRNVIDALEPFRDRPLESEPGKLNYTTYGFTLLSAVVEKAAQRSEDGQGKRGNGAKGKKEQIEDYWVKVLHRDWDMSETWLDQDEPVISNRARYYLRTRKNGGLINAPYTDNSVKWAGGGLISSARDLIKFGNTLLDSYKARAQARLKRSTVELLWTEVHDSYCLGFSKKQLKSGPEKTMIYHTGSAIGASSVLIIYPETEIVVAVLANLGEVNLMQPGIEIANKFAQIET